MPGIVRIGDTSDHGGVVISSNATFVSNGKQACVDGDLHQCPQQGHGTTAIIGTASFKSNNRNSIKGGDRAGCGATIISSGNVNTD